MLTKGIIKTIDYKGNTCQVHIPFFDGAVGGNPFIQNAIFINPPGIYGGYKPNDVVVIGFEDQELSKVIILGKLYLGTNYETECRGTINCESLLAENKVILPSHTELNSFNSLDIADVSGGSTSYSSISDIISGMQKLDNTETSDRIVYQESVDSSNVFTTIGKYLTNTGKEIDIYRFYENYTFDITTTEEVLDALYAANLPLTQSIKPLNISFLINNSTNSKVSIRTDTTERCNIYIKGESAINDAAITLTIDFILLNNN